MYTSVDAALLRVAAGTTIGEDEWPDPATDDPSTLIGWIRAVLAEASFAAGVEIASPSLIDQIQRLCARPDPDTRSVRRCARALVKYRLRATTRATPFGLFAGIAPLRVGDTTDVRIGTQDHVVARVAGTWLDGVIDHLQRSHALVRRLSVVVSELAVARDDRLVVDPTVSVRLSAAVTAILERAGRPVVFGVLADWMAARFPGHGVGAVESMLLTLIQHQVLITALRPAMTDSDPISHVIDTVEHAGAAALDDDVAPLLRELQRIQDDLRRHDRALAPQQRRTLRAASAARMRAVQACESPVGVDARVDVDATLPAVVVREAERAATLLAQLAPPPAADAAWGDYRRRFLDRYGIGATIPVRELLFGAGGLGYPAGYRGSYLPHPARAQRDDGRPREDTLLRLAHRAAWHRDRCLDLTDEDIAAITNPSAAGTDMCRPHLELRAEVHATSATAVDTGEFLLWVLSISRAAGTILGRFLDLLEPVDQARLQSVFRTLPTATAGALPVQLTCPPAAAVAATVARGIPVLPHVVALAQLDDQRSDDRTERIALDDLAVSADAHGLYLVSISRGRPVEPLLFSAIELIRAAHPTLRFLAEIGTAHTATPGLFPWGPARRLPHLPRVRYGRAVLSPARWRLHASDTPDSRDGVTRWRQRWDVPDTVVLGDTDQRLRLDLTQPAHLDVLRDQVRRVGHATVCEAPPRDAFGWIDGRAHEVVLPMATDVRPRHPARPRPTAAPQPRPLVHLPAVGRWLSVRVHTRPDLHSAVLVDHLPQLRADLHAATGHEPVWWFLRHTDPEPHLRLRIAVPAAATFATVAPVVGDWAERLRRAGSVARLEFDTYQPETGRFGADVALEAAEAVFVADSAAALAQLRLTHSHCASDVDHTVTAAGMLDLVTAFASTPREGWRWLLEHAPRTVHPSPQRHRGRTLHLTGPGIDEQVLSLPAGPAVLAAWDQRRTALTAYRAALCAAGVADPMIVLPDLLHLHHARVIGLSLDSERTCLHLARAAALCRIARTDTAA